jgi:hypothetical protein
MIFHIIRNQGTIIWKRGDQITSLDEVYTIAQQECWIQIEVWEQGRKVLGITLSTQKPWFFRALQAAEKGSLLG